MYLDKGTKELVVKVVYAGDGNGALDQVAALASKAKPGTATALIPLGETVRSFTQHIRGIQVRGFSLRVEILGASLDGLRAELGAAEADALEKTIVTSDAVIFVVGPEQTDPRTTFQRVRTELDALGSNGAKTPMAVIATGGIDVAAALATKDISVSTGPNAMVTALQAVIKVIVQQVTSGLGN
jgi:hypothetical protein